MQHPRCLALLLAESATFDDATEALSLASIFDVIHVTLPLRHHLTIYLCTQDVHEPVTLRLFDPSGKRLLNLSGTPRNAGKPMGINHEALQVEVVFRQYGIYHCELSAGGNLLMGRPFEVLPMK